MCPGCVCSGAFVLGSIVQFQTFWGDFAIDFEILRVKKNRFSPVLVDFHNSCCAALPSRFDRLDSKPVDVEDFRNAKNALVCSCHALTPAP